MSTRIGAIFPVMSAPLVLRSGLKIYSGGVEVIIREIDEEGVLLQNLRSGEYRRAPEEYLISSIQNGLVSCEDFKPRTLGVQVTDAGVIQAEALGGTQKAIQDWEAKIAWLKALRERGIDRLVDEPWVRAEIHRLSLDALQGIKVFSIRTLYEADLEIRKAQGDLTAILPRYNLRGGGGRSRLDPEIFGILCSEIQKVLVSKGPIVKNEIYQAVIDRVSDLNNARPEEPAKAPPGESTTLREIKKQIPSYIIAARNRGKRYANSAYRSNSQSRDRAERINEVGEYDDIDCNVFCVDERTGLSWGRPYATNGIDQATLTITGFDLSDKFRNFDSALGAICDSLLPKAGLQPGEMGYGSQGVILLDNAMYNASMATYKQAAAARLLLALCRPRGPTEKNTNEHFNHIVKSDFCPRLFGWAGKKGDREAVAEGMASAVFDIDFFRRMYFHWLTKIYANMVGDDGYTSKQRWHSFLRHGAPAVRYTAEQLALMRLRPLNKSLTFRESGGLLRLRLRYDSPSLDELRRRLGNTGKVEVLVDSRTMTYIVVVNPFTKGLLRVPCTEQADYIANLTEYQQILILRMCRQRGKKNPDIKDLVQARDELERLTAQAATSGKLRQRRWARIARGNSAIAATNEREADEVHSGEQRTVIMTELEYEMEELQTIELEEEDQW